VRADEDGRIEPALQRGQAPPHHVHLPAGAQLHVVAEGLDIFDVGHGDAQETLVVLHEKTAEVRRALRGHGRAGAGVEDARGAGRGPAAAKGIGRLEDVVDRRHVECVDRVPLVRGDEDHQRPSRGLGLPRQLQAARSGHLDVEEHHVGIVRGNRLTRFPRVPADGDDLHSCIGAQHFLQMGSRQRFVVDDNGAHARTSIDRHSIQVSFARTGRCYSHVTEVCTYMDSMHPHGGGQAILPVRSPDCPW
jgi:hypothetical protein